MALRLLCFNIDVLGRIVVFAAGAYCYTRKGCAGRRIGRLIITIEEQVTK
jgi:hypothetical protein